ncbi:sensor domain-containing diguanylate cyclase [Aliikangiella coralliicola]|uniref:Diguanylate cyclase n=1 Tax=Aliikangiella coralliicola TaxID=2592383 RepID=A0A545UF94_9GAMM|nr:sensor domain-containing diguanylate cyclase [Aliikangiella coralliicola]TQV88139.1 diguanylate cyclase [Aliikangiella coralliicola]
MKNISAKELMAIINNVAGIATLSVEGQYLDVNQAFCDITGYLEDELVGMNFSDITVADDIEQVNQHINSLKAGKSRNAIMEKRYISKSGEIKWIVLSSTLVKKPQPRKESQKDTHYIVSIIQDISAQKKLEEENRLAEVAFRHSGDGILITDAQHTIIRTNTAFTKISGFCKSDIIGRKPFLLRSGEHDNSFYNQIWKTLELEGIWQGEICYRHKNGSLFYVWETISAVTNAADDVTNYVSILADMTEMRRRQKTLGELANYDALTELPNRYYFEANLTQAMEMAKRRGDKVGLLFIDLDKFKPINDQYGHKAGDNLLIEVGHRLSDIVRKEDTAARIGGDEFVILMPKISNEKDIRQTAERIQESFKPPIYITESKTVTISASIGVSIYPDDLVALNPKNQQFDNEPDILELADLAMYKAKQTARGICFFDQLNQTSNKTSNATAKS